MAEKIKKRHLGRGLASLLGEDGEAKGFKNASNWDIFTIPISLAGIPAMNLPISNINGLPIGIQICSNYFKENNLLLMSQFVENTFIN